MNNEFAIGQFYKIYWYALERSIKTSNRVDDSDEDLQETVRAGVIQHFEVAYELSWNTDAAMA